MSEERIFNIFLYFNNGVANEYGMRHHRVGGTDADKTAFLASRISDDHKIARRFQLRRNFTPEEWRAVLRAGDALAYFGEAFDQFNAPLSPIYCATAVVDGVPTVDQRIGPDAFRGDEVSNIEGYGTVPDYLVHYTKGNKFLFTDLIHDDYFKAIKSLFNAGLYVSCAKLLMSCVDTLSFVEHGDKHGNFATWLDTYVDLSLCGIASSELWEFRNSILHMTNLASKKVISGKLSPIMPYVGGPNTTLPIRPDIPKPFNLHLLIIQIGNGIGKWGETYNSDKDKLLKFIERYDTTISDGRMAVLQYRRDTE